MDTATVRLEGLTLNVRTVHDRMREVMAELGAEVVEERRLACGASVITFAKRRPPRT